MGAARELALGRFRRRRPIEGRREEPELEETYERLVGEGHERPDRPLLALV